MPADKFGPIEPAAGGRVEWGGGCRAELEREPGALRMIYAAGDGQRFNERFELAKDERSHRWRFTCPGCDRGAYKLYKAPGSALFRCRRCHGLTYASVQERRRYEGLAKSVARHSGGGMHWKHIERYLIHGWGKL